MNNTAERLAQIKKKIDAAAEEKAKAEGALDQTMAQLKSEFNCSTIPTAEKKLQKMHSEAETLQGEMDDGIKELEEMLYE